MAKPLDKKQIQEIIATLPGLNRDILEQSDEAIEKEDIGLLYDEDMYQNKCRFILENIPYQEPISSQAAYLLRAIMCSQMFNEGNKRTAIVFTEIWIEKNGFHLKVSNQEVWDFIKYLPLRCPRIPISNQEILSKDSLYQEIEKWMKERLI